MHMVLKAHLYHQVATWLYHNHELPGIGLQNGEFVCHASVLYKIDSQLIIKSETVLIIDSEKYGRFTTYFITHWHIYALHWV